jgi:hypothetical protein
MTVSGLYGLMAVMIDMTDEPGGTASEGNPCSSASLISTPTAGFGFAMHDTNGRPLRVGYNRSDVAR